MLEEIPESSGLIPELSYKSFLQIKSSLKHSKFADVAEAFESARLIKDATEIEKIQEACDIASKGTKKIPAMLKDGVRESSVASEMAYEMKKPGGSGVSLTPSSRLARTVPSLTTRPELRI